MESTQLPKRPQILLHFKEYFLCITVTFSLVYRVVIKVDFLKNSNILLGILNIIKVSFKNYRFEINMPSPCL